MANMIDYVYWRGDLSFRISKFNEIDNIIFANLIYLSFEGVVGDKPIPLQYALLEALKSVNNEEKGLGVLLPSDIFVLAKAVIQAKRFANILVSDYHDFTDYSIEKQFKAMTFHLNDSTCYVCFCGTDDTIVGWKENFNILYLDSIPSEYEAITYLKFIHKKYQKKYYLGGHSKGGHLALYAGIYADEVIQNDIISIYNNDGQGFKVVPSCAKNICDKVINIFPKDSIVGMLLNGVGKISAVNSTGIGFLEHDSFSWPVLSASFYHLADVSNASHQVSLEMNSLVLEEYTNDELEFIINDIFVAFRSNSRYTLTDVVKEKTRLLFKYFGFNAESRAMLRRIISIIRRGKIFSTKK